MPIRIVSLVAYVILNVCAVIAQPSQYHFSQLNISNGLSHNQVNSILKDRKGFMWFGTMLGLNRYDGYGFKVFKHVQSDSTSINDDNILNIQEGPSGKLWIQTRLGYVFYDPVKETFDRHPEILLRNLNIKGSLIDIRSDKKGIFWIITSSGLYRLKRDDRKASWMVKNENGLYATALGVNSKGDVWLICNNGLLKQVSGETSKVIFQMRISGSPEPLLYRLFIDRDNDIWVYSTDRPRGVFYLDSGKGIKKYYTKNGRRSFLNTNNIYTICQDDKGYIWIGTDHGGINILDKKTDKITYLLSRDADEKALAQNSTTTIYKDNTGIMWVGTFKKGISYYHENILKFPVFRHQPSDLNTINYDDVNRFVEDKKGNLWIGTNGGGLIYFDRQKNKYFTFKHNPSQVNSLSNDVIVSLCIDYQQRLWIGTYFGGLDCYDGKTFSHYKHSEADDSSLSDDRVWEILEDSEHNLWVGTLAGGLNRFDRRTKSFKRIRSAPGTLRSNYIAALIEDRKGNLWIGTDNGIDVRNKQTGKFVHYSHSETNPASLSNDNVISLLEDSEGNIWVGTQDGLNIFDPIVKGFRTLRTTDGLPDNTVLTMLEDARHRIWLSTPNGISCVSVSRRGGTYSYSFINYDEMDGLQGREFNENAALRTKKGELIFGGANGFNIFNPAAILANTIAPAVVLTDFQLFNKSISAGEAINGSIILKNSISETRELTLRYDQNVFSIEFAALNLSNAAKNKYMYMLEGFNSKWLVTDGRNRKATFTNLDPGEYTFRVRASNDSGVWNNEGVSLRITVLPPLWKTPLAYAFYAAAVVCLLLYIRHRGIRNLKAQFALEQERQTAHRMHELDMMKIRFFTNVSHEFRTPLSLILSPLDKLLKDPDGSKDRRHLELIQRNARRLLNMVNQLMDFRKMEVNQLKLQPEEDDIIAFIKESFQSFTDLAEKKNILYSLRSDIDTYVTRFDHDKIERILFNLLSNAFKFTSEGGEVKVALLLENRADGTDILRIRVSDTGIGIPQDKQERIFERFFQNDVPGSMVNQGSGIGLSITKEFVNLHKGRITVESAPGSGSCFEVELPVQAIALSRSVGDIEETRREGAEEALPSEVPGREEKNHKKQTILLVEDNEDFRFYLKENLCRLYNIIEAGNGKAGWSKALADHPDLIVSDISMPEMNGIDLCLKIRKDKRTLHIPVILLTAITGEEQLLRGLKTGANDYMTKPFNFEILISKIRNLLIQNESLRLTYQKQIEIKPVNIEVVSLDEKFVQQVHMIIARNISNPDFSVEELSKEMCMSRVALYKKLLQLTRQTPIEFIRKIRLERSVQLLEKSQFTISEIAYEVGFNSPRYFARYFKDEYGVLPSFWLKQKKAGSQNTIREDQ